MIPGFNHNVRRGGRTYHVQTEDLGVSNPVVVTHLFSGGSVMASRKTEYRDLLAEEDLPHRVRLLMQRQHQEMLRTLVEGAFDPGREP